MILMFQPLARPDNGSSDHNGWQLVHSSNLFNSV